MSVGFVLWSMTRFNHQSFAFCGKTIESLRRNVITPLHTLLEGLFSVKECISKNYIEISAEGKTNRYYLFGGRDESSYSLVQGITLAGVLLDEVALMPRSFVEQALARCSIEGSKMWFNCNPEGPSHWFLKEWIEKADEKNALHLHFTMNDNLSLSESIKKRYEGMYSGVFYERYIQGLWVVAEGIIYDMFDKNVHVVTTIERKYSEYMLSCDYGTLNATAIGLWGYYDKAWYLIKEYYYSGREKQKQKTDEEYYQDLIQFAEGFPVHSIIIDPSAASFITCIRRHGKFIVLSASNSVIDGIRFTASLFQCNKLFINNCCKNTIIELQAYRWDEKSSEDKPIKENDHACDMIRYFCYTHIRRNAYKYGINLLGSEKR